MYVDVVEFLVVVAILPFYHKMTSNEKEQKGESQRSRQRKGGEIQSLWNSGSKASSMYLHTFYSPTSHLTLFYIILPAN